jgi:hypothetical protein
MKGKFWNSLFNKKTPTEIKPLTERELLQEIYRRLGWALVWLFLILVAIGDLAVK